MNEKAYMNRSMEVFRVIDAAANRAGEGLRVIEDFVRFTMNDGHLSRLLKECRHELTSLVGAFSESARMAARDTLGDVGTSIGLGSEYCRPDLVDVVRASFKRVQEALRSLEEFSKFVAGDSEASQSVSSNKGSGDNAGLGTSIHFEQLRYRLYTLEKAVLTTNSSCNRLRDARLYLLVSESHCRAGFEAVVRSALDAGVQIIQMREKTMQDRDLVLQARKLRKWTSEVGAFFIVNDRPDIAVLSDADGVHVGQEELPVRDVRRIVGSDRLVGVSTHSIEQARQAVLDGADYLGVGPTFPSETKSFDRFPGIELVRAAASEISLPWFAIGGINVSNIGQVSDAGATRFAIGNAILGAFDPGKATTELLRASLPAETER